MKRNLILIFTGLLLISANCKKKKVDDEIVFNKQAMLENISDNFVAPALSDFNQKIDDFSISYAVFEANQTEVNLNDVRLKFDLVYFSWQKLSPFDFGPIRDNGLKNATNTYPTDSSKIANNISAGTYVLGSASNVDAIGLPALEFMLYRANALSYFQNDANYRNYAADLIQKMKTEIETVSNQWNGYRSTFVASTGTETTSAFSQLVNEFNREYELAKNAKLGIPIGKQSLGVALPDYLEGRFSGKSLDLLKENVSALKAIFQGGSGVGFDDYLIQLERETLSTAINSKFDEIISKINSFSGSLEENITSNPSGLDDLYLKMSQQVVYLKTDMTSSFGVLITYQDNDGD